MPQNTDRDPDVQRDNQQIQDDNQSSGESVVGGQTSGDAQQPTGVGNRYTPNQAAKQEPAEGSRETAAGISNRPLSEEIGRQENLPPRGEAKDDSHA
jgi:hypothetical protein